MRTVEILRNLPGTFPLQFLFRSQLYDSGDRLHYFPSTFGVKLLSSPVYTTWINRVKFCLPVTLTWELGSVTHDLSVHPVYSRFKQEKLTVLVTGFLRILYPLSDVTAYLWKMCFIALEGTQQSSLRLVALIFSWAGFVLPVVVPCFCLFFHA